MSGQRRRRSSGGRTTLPARDARAAANRRGAARGVDGRDFPKRRKSIGASCRRSAPVGTADTVGGRALLRSRAYCPATHPALRHEHPRLAACSPRSGSSSPTPTVKVGWLGLATCRPRRGVRRERGQHRGAPHRRRARRRDLVRVDARRARTRLAPASPPVIARTRRSPRPPRRAMFVVDQRTVVSPRRSAGIRPPDLRERRDVLERGVRGVELR